MSRHRSRYFEIKHHCVAQPIVYVEINIFSFTISTNISPRCSEVSIFGNDNKRIDSYECSLHDKLHSKYEVPGDHMLVTADVSCDWMDIYSVGAATQEGRDWQHVLYCV